MRDRARTRSRDCSQVICCDDPPDSQSAESIYTTNAATDLKDLAQYDELVRNASKKAKEMDEIDLNTPQKVQQSSRLTAQKLAEEPSKSISSHCSHETPMRGRS